jgi:hypothetical protein
VVALEDFFIVKVGVTLCSAAAAVEGVPRAAAYSDLMVDAAAVEPSLMVVQLLDNPVHPLDITLVVVAGMEHLSGRQLAALVALLLVVVVVVLVPPGLVPVLMVGVVVVASFLFTHGDIGYGKNH